MPRKAKEMTPIEIKRLKHDGRKNVARYNVGGVTGLMMYIQPTGGKSWVYRATVGGKRRHIGLGGYPDVPLGMARDRAREMQDQIFRGIDPLVAKQEAAKALKRSITVAEAVGGFLAVQTFGNEKMRKQWISSMDQHVLSVIGDRDVASIDVQDLAEVFLPIWADKYPTAKKVRQRVEAVFGWATVNGYREGANPALLKNNLDLMLPKAKAKAAHHPAVSTDDAAEFYTELMARDGNATRALQLVMLTAARSGEVRGATWAEIDLKKRLWTIPADRMKASRDHVVALSGAAVELLMAQPRDSDLVFPAQRGGMLSDMALSACMKRINKKRPFLDKRSGGLAVPHGLRSTFRDWAAEHTDYPADMAEFALAHVVGSDVVRAYQRTTQVDKRRAMMADWSEFLGC